MGFTEFYVRAGKGDNRNSGSTPAPTPAYTSTNGAWDGNTLYTPSNGSTPANFVNVGDFLALLADAGSVAAYIARVTNVAAGVNGAITVSATAVAGAKPGVAANGMTARVGGCWSGPAGAVAFPFGVAAAALQNAAGNIPRINFQGYFAVTAAMTQTPAGPLRFEGYGLTPGDQTPFILDGGSAGASYDLLALNGDSLSLHNAIIHNNGATGNAAGIKATGGTARHLRRVTISGMTGNGFQDGSSGANIASLLEACEVFGNNTSNTASAGGVATIGATFIHLRDCLIHHHGGTNSRGVRLTGGGFLEGCALTENRIGLDLFPSAPVAIGEYLVDQTRVLFSLSDGIKIGNNIPSRVELRRVAVGASGGWGINNVATAAIWGRVANCAFGRGALVNTSGDKTGDGNFDLAPLAYFLTIADVDALLGVAQRAVPGLAPGFAG